MRTATAPELAVLAGPRTITYRVKVANGTGTMIDLSSWVEHVEPADHDVDQPVAGATVYFTRANGVLQTLSPLRTDSTLNVKDDLTYAPQLDLARPITIEVATTALGVLPGASDFKLMLDGTCHVIDSATPTIPVTCRDKGGVLVDRWVEAKKNYGSTPGVAVQTVMQSIHDDVFGAGVVPVHTPVSPGYLIAPAYQQQMQSVMDADVALAQNPGWDVRYRWDDGTSAFRFTFKEPGRAKTTPDHTFGPSAYFDVTKLELAETDIRNVVIIEFRNSANQGNRETLIVTDGPSITKYGRKPLIIIEGDTSPIDTVAEATTLANSALSDLKDPKADMEIVMPLFWPMELGDLYRFSANGVHFNTDQDLAVVSFTHSDHETQVRVRGKPAGQYLTWLGRGQTIGGGGGGGQGGNNASPPMPFIDFLDGEIDDTIWNVRFDAIYGSGGGGTNLTYGIIAKRSFDAVASLATGNASTLPRTLAIARDPKYEKVITFTVTDAATALSAQDSFTMPSQRAEINTAGDTFTSGVKESGGRVINRLFAKPLAADPDGFDSVPDGTTYKRIVSVSGGKATSGSLGALAVTDAAVNDVAAGKTTAGTFVSGVLESGGKAINRIFAKSLAADPDTLDSAPDGTTYKKIVSVNGSGQITPPSSAGRSRAKIFNSGSQTATTAVDLILTWDSETYDVGALHSGGSPTAIVIPAGGNTGAWLITGQVSFDANSTGDRVAFLTKNSSVIATGAVRACAAKVTAINLMAWDDVPSVGDSYELVVNQTSGGNLGLAAGAHNNSLAATHVW